MSAVRSATRQSAQVLDASPPGWRWGVAGETRYLAGRPLLEAAAVGMLVALALLLALPDTRPAGAYADDGAYLALGRALADGNGYRSIYAAGAPVHTRFPPGLPLLLAGIWRAAGALDGVLAAARALNVVAVGVAAGLLWWLARRRLGLEPLLAALLVVGPLFLDGLLEYFGLALAEPYFLLGWALALVLVAPVAAGGRLVQSLGLGLVVGGTLLFRTQAAVFVPAVLIALRMRGASGRILIACAVGALLPFAVWKLSLAPAHGHGSPLELSYVGDLRRATGTELGRFIQTIALKPVVYPGMLSLYFSRSLPVGGIPVLLLGALCMLGLVRTWRPAPELALTFGGVLSTLLVWPVVGDRLVLTVLPFAGLAAGAYVQPRIRRLPSRVRWTAAALALAAAAAVAWRQADIRREGKAAAGIGRAGVELAWMPAYHLELNGGLVRSISAWTAAHTRPDDVLLTPLPEGVYLYTGRRGVTIEPMEASAHTRLFAVPGRFTAERIRRDGVRVVVVGRRESSAARDVPALMRRCPAALRALVYGSGPAFPAYYRVTGADGACLDALLAGRTAAPF